MKILYNEVCEGEREFSNGLGVGDIKEGWLAKREGFVLGLGWLRTDKDEGEKGHFRVEKGASRPMPSRYEK